MHQIQMPPRWSKKTKNKKFQIEFVFQPLIDEMTRWLDLIIALWYDMIWWLDLVATRSFIKNKFFFIKIKEHIMRKLMNI
jgi:hypothetical protein